MEQNKITTPQAVEQLSKALREDPGYWESWKANIAMCIYDQYVKEIPKSLEEVSHYDIIQIANTGADNFLKLLTVEKTTENEQS